MARQLPPSGFAGHIATSLRVVRKKRLVGNGWLKANAPTPIRHGCQIEANRRGGGRVQAASHRILHRFLPRSDLLVLHVHVSGAEFTRAALREVRYGQGAQVGLGERGIRKLGRSSGKKAKCAQRAVEPGAPRAGLGVVCELLLYWNSHGPDRRLFAVQGKQSA